MLGFGGHFATKSRRYSTTHSPARRPPRLAAHHPRRWPTATDARHSRSTTDDDTTLIVGDLTFAGIGWHTTADALLATAPPPAPASYRVTAREERTIA